MSTSARPKVLVYTIEVLGETMAGPGIRALRFAEALSAVAEVRLVSAVRADLQRAGFDIVLASGEALLRQLDWAEVVVLQSPLLTTLSELQTTEKIVITDLYDPFPLERLQQSVYLDESTADADVEFTLRAVADMVRFGDFIVCASEKQRDLWMGELMAQGRLNVTTYRADQSLRGLIDVVPFGVDSTPPRQRWHGIKGTVPGIGPDDTVLLWGGGIYDWFDPLTLIQAVAKLALTRPDLRLFFLAAQHANPEIGRMRMADDARALAERLGILGTHVFFNERWVPHAERADWFLDADLGVSTHLDHLETNYSFRTRLLDYLWAGLPIINTAGDAFEPLIRERGLGEVVPPGDVDALAAAIDGLLADDTRRTAAAAAARELAAELSWERALEPVVRFVAEGRRAPDEPRRNGHVDVTGRVAQLESELSQLRASSSWRATAPLRAVVDRVRRLRGR